MDITTILNRKGSAAMVAADGQFDHQHLVPNPGLDTSSPKMKSEPGVSDAGDQAVLAYPPHGPLGQVPNMAHDMRYAHQAHPGPGLPLLQNPFVPGAYAGGAQIPNAGAPQGRPDPPPKTFHCGTCGKGFARRSDLARHGKHSSLTRRETVS